MNLTDKTIIIQLEPLKDNDDEVQKHALDLFNNLENCFNQAQHIAEIRKAENN